MRMPTEQQAIDWALSEARRYPDEPSQQRKYLLVLAHLIKRMDRELRTFQENPSENLKHIEHKP